MICLFEVSLLLLSVSIDKITYVYTQLCLINKLYKVRSFLHFSNEGKKDDIVRLELWIDREMMMMMMIKNCYVNSYLILFPPLLQA